MKCDLAIRRTTLVALLVLAISGFGLPSLFLNSQVRCDCRTAEPCHSFATVPASSCRKNRQTVANSCCSVGLGITKKSSKSGCCCNPAADVCRCVDCKCNVEDEDSAPPSPALPSNENTEVVSLSLICAFPSAGYPRDSSQRQFGGLDPVIGFPALSSQERCVLLSRFTC